MGRIPFYETPTDLVIPERDNSDETDRRIYENIKKGRLHIEREPSMKVCI